MTKKERRRLFLEFGTVSLLIFGLIVSTFSDWRTIMYNKEQANELESKYTSLLEEERILESEVTKLYDDEYLSRIAREDFYYTKPGELLIIIPENE